MAELVLEKEQLDQWNYVHVPWSAYHANRQAADIRPVSPISLKPLFTKAAHSEAMMAHTMKLSARAIQHLHTSQIPVITMDQSLYSIAKQIQWTWSDTFWEDKFLVVMGGLHIEMNMMKLPGDILTGSGWTAIPVQSKVTTSGRAVTILKGSHVTRSRSDMGELIVNAHALIMHSFFPVIQGNNYFTSFCITLMLIQCINYFCKKSLHHLHYFELLSNRNFTIRKLSRHIISKSLSLP